MKYNPDIHKRQSIRLKEYDYSEDGAYFVTVCAKDRECIFGTIEDQKVILNDASMMVGKWWMELANKFSNIELDKYVIMPNHFHGIIVITSDYCRGEVASPLNVVGNKRPKQMGGETPPLHKHTLGQIVAYFKYQSTKAINITRENPGVPIWQRNYYEHVIRNENALYAVRKYIQDNPLNWDEDDDNPKNN